MFVYVGLFTVTVMRLIVKHEDVFQAHQVGHDALDHLAFRLFSLKFIASAACQKQASALGKFDSLTELEGVVVGDDDLGAIDIIEHVARYQFAVLVVAIGVVRLQNA